MPYIKEIQVMTPKGMNNIVLYLPIPNDKTKQHTITVIAGKNRSGKTHILQNVNKGLEQFAKRKRGENKEKNSLHSNVSIVLDDEQVPSFEIFKRIDSAMDMGDKISYQTRHKRQEYVYLNEYRKLLFEFAADIIQQSPLLNKNFRKNDFINEEDYRKKIIIEIEREAGNIYPCNSNIPMVHLLEKAFGAHLYIGVPGSITDNKKNEKNLSDEHYLVLYMYFDEKSVYPYPVWSTGQQALFSYLLFIYYNPPNIMLIDELENHLHPEYMSIVIEALKAKVPQTIIATHHPHLLFSTHIDQVFYIESNISLANKDLMKKKSIPLNNGKHSIASKNMPPFPRTITNLVEDFEKITSLYHLFDDVDNNLIKLADGISTRFNITVLKILEKAFSYPPVPASEKRSPDIQNSKIVDHLKSKLKHINDSIKILDYGAGIGRTYDEVNKRILAEPFGKHEWTLWEPYHAYQTILIERFSDIGNVIVPQHPNQLSCKYYDVAILSNVLHECNPFDFTTMVSQLHHSLNDSGELIVIELSPLMDPEKMAVAYESSEMLEIFGRGSGWAIEDFETISLGRVPVQAYWIWLRKQDDYDKNSFYLNLLKIWEKIESKHTLTYSQRMGINRQFQLHSLLHEMMALASIASYKKDDWKSWLTSQEYHEFQPNR